jgi:hypothetical protein
MPKFSVVIQSDRPRRRYSQIPYLYPQTIHSGVSNERKFAILFAATLLCARKLMDVEDKPSRAKICTLDKAVRKAAYILGEIDKKWPSKTPLTE